MKNRKYTVLASACGILILLAAIVRFLPFTWMVRDTEKDGIIAIGAQTKELLSGLEQDVTLRYVVGAGKESKTIEAMLERYKAGSSHVKVVREDASSEENQIIVETDVGSETIRYETLTDLDYEAFLATGKFIQKNMLEQKLSYAIYLLTSPDAPVLYRTVNHEEPAIEESMLEVITQSGMRVQDFSLEDGIPSDASGVLIAGATKDITEAESAALEEYLAQGGYLLLLSDVTEEETPNLDALMAGYGAVKENGVVFEKEDPYLLNADYPYYLVPAIGEGELAEYVKSLQIPPMLLLAHGITLTETNPSVTVEQILGSSDTAFIKSLTAHTMEQEPDDPVGPFALAVTIRDQESGARIDWFSSSSLLSVDNNQEINNTDIRLVAKAAQTGCKTDGAVFKAKEMADYSVTMTESAISKWSLGIFAIPLVLAAIGVFRKSRVS